MPQAPRKPILPATQVFVLDRSRRRCALCFHLNGDLSEKKGQIAHLDGNRTNDAEGNLVWLCLNHHDDFDGSTSQSKNYTVLEVKKARDDLYRAIEEGRHLGMEDALPAGRDADRNLLRSIQELLSQAVPFARNVNFGSPFQTDFYTGLGILVWDRRGADHEFIDTELESLRAKLVSDAEAFVQLVGYRTFPTRTGVGLNDVPYSEGEDDEDNTRYHRYVGILKELHDAAEAVCLSYDNLIRVGRRKLED
jgi:hypothetical protein